MPDGLNREDGADTTREETEVQDVFIASASDQEDLQSSSRVEEPGDRGFNRPDARAQEQPEDTDTLNTRVDPGRRIGALQPDLAGERSSPVIEIVERRPLLNDRTQRVLANGAAAIGALGPLGAAAAGLTGAVAGQALSFENRTILGVYNGFILTQIQEVYGEKVNVTETFGNPHIFASGQFIRKYTFSGVCRTSAVNYRAQDAALRLPQHVTMRVLYEQYLRATKMIENDRFARLVVDGDIYEGYVVSMNFGRASQPEHFANFTFTMLALRRDNHRHENDARRLLDRQFKPTTRAANRFVDRIATAQLADSLGQVDLSMTVGEDLDNEVKTASFTGVTISSQDREVKTNPLRLVARGTNQVLRVSSPAGDAVRLIYKYRGGSETGAQAYGSNASAVNGSAAIVVAEGERGHEIGLEITNYNKLFTLLRRQGGTVTPASTEFGSETVTGALTLTISSPSGSSVTITYNLKLEGGAGLEITRQVLESEVAGLVQNKAIYDADGQTDLYPSLASGVGNYRAYTSGGAQGLASAPGLIPLELTVYLSPKFSSEDISALFSGGNLTASIGEVSVFPALSGSGIQSGTTLKGGVTIASVVPNSENQSVTIRLDVDVSHPDGLDLTDPESNPLGEADRIAIAFRYSLKAVGFKPITGRRVQVNAVLKNESILASLGVTTVGSLNSIGYVKRPDGRASFGTLSFGATTDDAPSPAVTAAIRDEASLAISFQGTLGRIDVPLNGTPRSFQLPISSGITIFSSRGITAIGMELRVVPSGQGSFDASEPFQWSGGQYRARVEFLVSLGQEENVDISPDTVQFLLRRIIALQVLTKNGSRIRSAKSVSLIRRP